MWSRIHLCCLLACSAPDGLPPQERGPEPAPEAPALPPPPAGPLPAEPAPAPLPARPTGPSPSLQPTAANALPEAPFTAWTARAPLTLVAPGGASLGRIEALGVRVDVVQALDARLRVVCVGCRGPLRDVEGWLPQGTVRAAGDPGGSEDPLVAGLRTRASLAGKGVDADAFCGLLDQGFAWSGAQATWSADGGLLRLTYDGQRWVEEARAAPVADPRPRSCQSAGLRGRPPGPTR